MTGEKHTKREQRAYAWSMLPPAVQDDLRHLLADPMIDSTRGVTIIQGGEVTWGEDYRERSAEFLAGPWNLTMRRREEKGRRK